MLPFGTRASKKLRPYINIIVEHILKITLHHAVSITMVLGLYKYEEHPKLMQHKTLE